jgi:hypothetical protein
MPQFRSFIDDKSHRLLKIEALKRNINLRDVLIPEILKEYALKLEIKEMNSKINERR